MKHLLFSTLLFALACGSDEPAPPLSEPPPTTAAAEPTAPAPAAAAAPPASLPTPELADAPERAVQEGSVAERCARILGVLVWEARWAAAYVGGDPDAAAEAVERNHANWHYTERCASLSPEQLSCWEQAAWANDAWGVCNLNEGREFRDRLDRTQISQTHPRRPETGTVHPNSDATLASLQGTWFTEASGIGHRFVFDGNAMTYARVNRAGEASPESYTIEFTGPYSFAARATEGNRRRSYLFYAAGDERYISMNFDRGVFARTAGEPTYLVAGPAMVLVAGLDAEPECHMMTSGGGKLSDAGCSFEGEGDARRLVVRGTPGANWQGRAGRPFSFPFRVFEDAVVADWNIGWLTAEAS